MILVSKIFFGTYRVPPGRSGGSRPPPGCSCHRIWPRSFRGPSRGPKSSSHPLLYLRAPVQGCAFLLPFSWCNFKPPYSLNVTICKTTTSHNVKSNLIWPKYLAWWPYRGIAMNPGASRPTKSWSSRLMRTFRKIPTWSHTRTEPHWTSFPKVSISY